MAAVKAYFYKLREDIPDVCEGVDIPRFIKGLKITFGEAVENVDPGLKIPGGPVFYTDSPRVCIESPKKYDIEDVISDCIRLYDKKGTAKKALASMIADKIVSNDEFRENLVAYNRVPQSWSYLLQPLDPEEKPGKTELVEALSSLQDRDYRHPTNAKGARHPLARILESQVFSDSEKLNFVADYLIGRKKKGAAPRAVRIGSRGDYQEFNRAKWLEANSAFVLETVGDLVQLKQHFTATNKLKRGSMPELKQLEPGDLKLTI